MRMLTALVCVHVHLVRRGRGAARAWFLGEVTVIVHKFGVKYASLLPYENARQKSESESQSGNFAVPGQTRALRGHDLQMAWARLSSPAQALTTMEQSYRLHAQTKISPPTANQQRQRYSYESTGFFVQ